MTTVIIDEKTPQGKQYLQYTRTLSFATVVDSGAKRKSFREASAQCNAVSVDEFFDELNARIEKWLDHA
jgi:hypothetical protein